MYITLNPITPDLLARYANRVEEGAEDLTNDRHVLRRRWLPVDFDATRLAKISATEEEHEAALQRAIACRAWLRQQRWPDPLYADSGNGAHLLYCIDLPNEAASTTLIARTLQALALLFNDVQVTVDETTFNAARVWKLYGTLVCKGDHLPQRPHRIARLIDVPEVLEVVSREHLIALAALLPEPPATTPRHRVVDREAFNLTQWIAHHKLPVVSQGPWSNGGYKWILNLCPWNPEHTNRAAYIVQFTSGAIAAGADCANIHVLTGWREQEGETVTTGSVTLADLPVIRTAVAQYSPVLVIIDPLQAYLGAKTDMYRANEVRPLLAALMLLAEQYDCAIVCVRHLAKAPQSRAIYRGLGSIDFTAAARSVLLVGDEPQAQREGEETGAPSRARRVLAHSKSSLAPKGPSLVFELREGKFYWRGQSPLTANELATGPQHTARRDTEVHKAEAWLRTYLRGEPRPAKEGYEAAASMGIATRTLMRAKKAIGVQSKKAGELMTLWWGIGSPKGSAPSRPHVPRWSSSPSRFLLKNGIKTWTPKSTLHSKASWRYAAAWPGNGKGSAHQPKFPSPPRRTRQR